MKPSRPALQGRSRQGSKPQALSQLCQTPFGELTLRRWPSRQKELLQAWDAADLLLLEHLEDQPFKTPLLILNDRFGALSSALTESAPVLWSDSELSRLAAVQNLQLNGGHQLNFVPADQQPEGRFNTVVCRVPKSLDHWWEQLLKLRGLCTGETRVVVAGMTKHLPHRALELMRSCLGPTERLRAVGKARLLLGSFDPDLPAPKPPQTALLKLDDGSILEGLPNVFSRERLDRGAQLMLSTFDQLSGADEILDLGCGNGILGISAQGALPRARVTLIDESYQAVASARGNYHRRFDAIRNGPPASFLVADGLHGYEGPQLDLILCNPPFHQQHQVGDWLAQRMFRQSHAHLKTGAELRVVANRHLGYHRLLKRIFGNSRVLTSNPKFVVLSALR